MYPPIAVPNARLTDIFDLDVGLIAPFGLVDIKGSFNPESIAGPFDRHLPIRSETVNKPAPTSRPNTANLVSTFSSINQCLYF